MIELWGSATNVHALVIEEPKSTSRLFILERDVTDADLGAIEKFEEEIFSDTGTMYSANYFELVKLLAYEKIVGLHIGRSRPGYKQKIKNLLQNIERNLRAYSGNGISYTITTAYLIYIGEKREVIKPDIDLVRTGLKQNRNYTPDLQDYNFYPAAKFLYPDEGEFQLLPEEEAHLNQKISYAMGADPQDYWQAISCAAILRIMGKNPHLSLNSEAKEKISAKIEHYRALANYRSFMTFAANLTVLSADRVEITKDGLILKSPDINTIKLPTERSF